MADNFFASAACAAVSGPLASQPREPRRGLLAAVSIEGEPAVGLDGELDGVVAEVCADHRRDWPLRREVTA